MYQIKVKVLSVYQIFAFDDYKLAYIQKDNILCFQTFIIIQSSRMESQIDKKSNTPQNLVQRIQQLQDEKDYKHPHVSFHKQQYEQFFKNIPHQKISIFQSNLRANNIIYLQQSKRSITQSQLQIIDATNNFSVINILIYIGKFQFHIRALNLKGSSPSIKNLKLLGSGANGRVYYFQNSSEHFVVKNIVYKNNSNSKSYFDITRAQNLLHDFLVEYCFCKLFSALRIGPLVKDYFGFHVLIFDNSAEFLMEYCPQLILNQQFLEQDLSESLKLMHNLKIIHGDIKPQNLRYSQSYKKAVFIDFGFCFITDLAVGDSMLTSFFGTPPYCCNQMRDALTQRKKMYVDVFYNDLFALKMSFKYFSQDSKLIMNNTIGFNIKIDNNQQNYFDKYEKFLVNIHLKSSVYQRNIKKVKQVSSINVNIINCDEIIELITEMSPSKNLINILNYILKQFYPFKKIYQQLLFFDQIKLSDQQYNFSGRVKQKLVQSLDRLLKDQIVVFVALMDKQDISQVAKIQKEQNLKLISRCNQGKDNGIFWKLFVQIIENFYTTKEQLMNIFEMAANILKMNKLDKFINQLQEHQIPMKIIQIRKKVLQKQGIDLIKYSISADQQKVIISKQQFQCYFKCSSANIKQVDQLYNYIISKQTWSENTEKTNRIIKWLQKNVQNNLLAQLFLISIQAFQMTTPELRKWQYEKLFEKMSNMQKISKIFLYFNLVFSQLAIQLPTRKCEETINIFKSFITNYNHLAFNQDYIEYFLFYSTVFCKFANKTTVSHQELQQITDAIKQFLHIIYEIKQYKDQTEIISTFILLNKMCIYCRYVFQHHVYAVISKTITKQLIIILNSLKMEKFRQETILSIYEYLNYNPQTISENELVILQGIGWRKQELLLFQNINLSLTIFRKTKEIILKNSVQLIQKLVFFQNYQYFLYNLKIKSAKQYEMSFDLIIEQFKLKQVPLNQISAYFLLQSVILHCRNPIDQEQEYKFKICDQYLINALNCVNKFDFVNYDNIKLVMQYKEIRLQTYGGIRYIMHFMRLGFINQILIVNSLTLYPLFDNLVCKFRFQNVYDIKLKINQLINQFIPYLEITKKQFYVIYADLIILIEQFLFILIRVQPLNKTQTVLIALYLMKMGSMMCFNCKSSFLRSRFRNIVKFISYYMIKGHILFSNSRSRRKEVALLKCLRASQFTVKQLEIQQLGKKITKKIQKLQTEVILKVKGKIINKIYSLNQNKKLQVQCTLQHSQLLNSYEIKKSLLNQTQVNL